jgi:uncharacterized RDD family membrane protein YckC
MSSHPSPDPPVPYQVPATPAFTPPLPGQPGYQWGGAIPTYPFASFRKRLLAALLDMVIVLALICVPLALGIVLMITSTDTTTHADGTSTSAVTDGARLTGGVTLIAVSVAIALLYEPLLTARKGARNGQTVGKQALGIRITNLQGGPISAGQAWGRSLFASLISKNLLYLGYLWMLWDAMRQTWHDKVAGTLVLETLGPTLLSNE